MCSVFEKALAAHEELAAPLCFSEPLTLQDKMETDAPVVFRQLPNPNVFFMLLKCACFSNLLFSDKKMTLG